LLVELGTSGYDNVAVSRMLDAIDQARTDQDQQGMVINLSGGTDLSATCFPGIPDTDREYVASLQRLLWQKPIQYASANGQQVLFVFSAGNNRVLFDDSFPASLSNTFPNVISVAATDRLANEASYSDYGSVSVWAPGGDQGVGMCPLGARNSASYLLDPLAQIGDPVATILVARADGNPPYDFIGVGTSLSAPFVSGVAGLMLSKKPDLTASTLKATICETAGKTGIDPSGNDVRLLNAFEAIQKSLTPGFDDQFDSESASHAYAGPSRLSERAQD
jgi:subtilisin family serine protease